MEKEKIKIDKAGRMLAMTSKNPVLLAELAKNEDWIVRLNVAKNKYTSKRVLIALASDTDWEVAAWLPDNPSCPEEVFKKLAVSDDTDILYYLINGAYTPAEIINDVVLSNKNADTTVLIAAIKSGKLTDNTLDKLTKNNNKFIADEAETYMKRRHILSEMKGA